MSIISTTIPRARRGTRGLSACSSSAVVTMLFASTLSSLTGCQSYERKPLDLNATRAAWLTRSSAHWSVREFAAALDRAEGGSRVTGFDPSDGLTHAEAEVVALLFSPDLRLARLEAGVTRATASHAGQWADPALVVGLERIVTGAEGANPWVASSTIGLTIPLSGRLKAERDRAGAGLAAELSRVAAKE